MRPVSVLVASPLLLALTSCGAPNGGGGSGGPDGPDGPGATGSGGGSSAAAAGGATAAGTPNDLFATADAGAGADQVSGIDQADKCGGLAIDTSVEVVSEPGNVLIVFDQSQSMTTDFGGAPLWQAASSAVRDALTPHLDMLTVGAIFFPTSPDLPLVIAECVGGSVAPIGSPPQIPFQPGQTFINAWNARWSAANLVLGTPTDMAMTVAGDALANAGLVGQVAVIVVTDGQPTCFMNPDSIGIAAAWAGLGIPTYVIGLPGAGPADAWLNQVAAAGGTGSYFTPADSQALTQEFTKIMGTVIKQSLNSCTVVFNEVPDKVTDMALVVTEAATGQRFKIEQGAAGWQLGADGASAELLGQSCDDALAGRFSQVSFEFGCENLPVLQ